MKHVELRVFRVVGEANTIGQIDRAIRDNGGVIVTTGGIPLEPWLTTYAAERSLQPEIESAISGKPGDRVG